MNRESWKAKWIWAQHTAGQDNVFIEARKQFQADVAVSRATLRISANQAYKLYINHVEIGSGPAPADLEWMTYDQYEVTDFIKNGSNTIAITAHNFGRDEIVTGQLQGPGGLICQLDLYGGKEDSIHPELSVATDADWKCRRSQRWKQGVSRQHYWNGYREIIDMAQEDGWEEAGYDDSSWPDAAVIASAEEAGSAWPRLLPREIPFLAKTTVYPERVIAAEAYLGGVSEPEAVLAANAGRSASHHTVLDASAPGSIPQIMYDFGKEVVGFPELDVYAEEGGVLQLFYGESLEVALTDTFLLRKGMNKLSPFGRRAFRYMKIAAMATPVPAKLEKLRIQFVHYPYPEGGMFRCSDERLNQIWEIGRYTTIVNSQNHFEDCPHREGALWVADSVVMAKVVYHTFKDTALVRKSLMQAARIQNDDGSIPGTGPVRNPFLLPDFCAHWLFGVWEYYCNTRDKAFLEGVWPYVVRLAEWFARQEDESGLFAKADRDGWWCFIDWSDDIERKDRVTAISCFYYKFLLTAARIAGELGDHDNHTGYGSKAAELRTAVRQLLKTPGASVFADSLTSDGLSESITAQTNFTAAWTGIMDRSEVDDFVVNYYLANKLPPIRGAFFYHIVLETLFQYGYAEEAAKQIREYWGAMVDRGATTWWETFDPSLPFATTPSPYMGHTPTYLQDAVPVSYSHGWGAAPTVLLTKELLGIDVSRLGMEGVALHPTPLAGIDWMEGAVPTVQGDIKASWRREENGLISFRAEIPASMAWSAAGLTNVSSTAGSEGELIITGNAVSVSDHTVTA